MLLLLLACGGDDGAPRSEAPLEAPPAYDLSDYVDQERPVSSFDQGAVEGALQTAIDQLLLTAATPVLQGYAEGMALADAGCPTLYDVDGNTVWYDYCTTDGGAYFAGYGFYYLYDDVDAFGDGLLYDGAVVTGLGQIVSPDGVTVEVGGTAGLLQGGNEDYDAFISVVQGSFSWDAPEADETWMAEGLRPSLQVYAITAPAYDAHYVKIDGGLDGLVDEDGQTLAIPTATLTGVLLADEIVGFPCDQEPTGTISVRDPNGAWFAVAFDVDENQQLTGVCDGCGEVTYNGEVVGEACADFSAWLDWGDSPW